MLIYFETGDLPDGVKAETIAATLAEVPHASVHVGDTFRVLGKQRRSDVDLTVVSRFWVKPFSEPTIHLSRWPGRYS